MHQPRPDGLKQATPAAHMLPLLLPLWLLGLNMLLLSQAGLQQKFMAPQPCQDGLLQLDICLKARTLQPDTCMSEMHCQEVDTEQEADLHHCHKWLHSDVLSAQDC